MSLLQSRYYGRSNDQSVILIAVGGPTFNQHGRGRPTFRGGRGIATTTCTFATPYHSETAESPAKPEALNATVTKFNLPVDKPTNSDQNPLDLFKCGYGGEHRMSKPKKPKPSVFIVLIGGPGKFAPCDREHDETWTNYIVPIQVATKADQLDLAPGETLQWWVYAPAYRERWEDDTAVVSDPKVDKGRYLVESRQKAINKVTSSGATDYLDRISKMAAAMHASFKALETPGDFWSALNALPESSVSRLWSIGHASSKGLMLKLIHDDSCGPAANTSDMILVADIAKNSGTVSKKMKAKGKPSKFYGCYTESFAEQWNTVFGQAAEGAINKIDFSVVDRPSDIDEVLPRLEQSNSDTGWTRLPATK